MTENDESQQAIEKILNQMEQNLVELSWFDRDLKDDQFAEHMEQVKASLKKAKQSYVKQLVAE